MGWRLALGSALAVVLGRPSLWVLGSLGFALRGGLLLLLFSVVVLPTPIELRMLLGSNLGSSGLAPSFVGVLFAGAIAVGILVLLVLAVLAYLELWAFERLLTDPELSEQLEDRAIRPPHGSGRRWLLAQLFGVQLLALFGLFVAAIPLTNSAVSLAYQEILRPSLGGTIYVRVLNGVRDEVVILGVGLVLVELVSSVATRRLLMRGFALASARPAVGALRALSAFARAVGVGLLRPLRRPVSTLATLSCAWLASLGFLLPIHLGLGIAWESVRGAYLAPIIGQTPAALLGLAIVTLGLCGLWAVAVLVGGFVSALRAALWSVDALR